MPAIKYVAMDNLQENAISSAEVPDVVRRILLPPPRRASNQSWHFLVNCPSPHILWLAIASAIYFSSFPVTGGLLNGIIALLFLYLFSQSVPQSISLDS